MSWELATRVASEQRMLLADCVWFFEVSHVYRRGAWFRVELTALKFKTRLMMLASCDVVSSADKDDRSAPRETVQPHCGNESSMNTVFNV